MKYLDKEHETAMQFYNEGYNDRMIEEAMYVSSSAVECQEMRKLLESYKRVTFERQNRIQELIEENYELQKRIRELERRQT